MSEIEKEILKASYWEHFKSAKDMALIYPVDHPRRKAVENELNKISQQLEGNEN